MAQERQPRRQRRQAKPLNAASLRALALHYVGRYATSSGKLMTYLQRKLRERGWDGEDAPALAELIEDFARLGYIDDAGFAAGRASSLLRRGFGASRIKSALRQGGVGDDLAATASAIGEDAAREAALQFARRKRLGPFAKTPVDQKAHQRAVAAMARAGHDFGLIREILAINPQSFSD